MEGYDMPRKSDRRRNMTINVYADTEEHLSIAAAAERAGVSMSTFLRNLALTEARKYTESRDGK